MGEEKLTMNGLNPGRTQGGATARATFMIGTYAGKRMCLMSSISKMELTCQDLSLLGTASAR